MIMQNRNPELVDILRADFQHRNEPNFAAKSLLAAFGTFPGIRGMWYGGNADEQLNCPDMTGQGRTMYRNSTPYLAVSNSINGLIGFDGATTADRLYRIDEPGLSITGLETYVGPGRQGLTIGGWFRANSLPASSRGLMGKWDVGIESYALYILNTGMPRFIISDGATWDAAVSTVAAATDRWYYFVGTWDPSTHVRLVVGDSQNNYAVYENLVAINATIQDTASGFYIGNHAANTASTWDGWFSIGFLAAAHTDPAQIRWVWEQTRMMYPPNP